MRLDFHHHNIGNKQDVVTTSAFSSRGRKSFARRPPLLLATWKPRSTTSPSRCFVSLPFQRPIIYFIHHTSNIPDRTAIGRRALRATEANISNIYVTGKGEIDNLNRNRARTKSHHRHGQKPKRAKRLHRAHEDRQRERMQSESSPTAGQMYRRESSHSTD